MSLIRALFIGMILLPMSVGAMEPAPISLDIRPEPIAILPIRDTGFTETVLFHAEESSRPVAIRRLATRLEAALKSALGDHPNVEMLSLETLKKRIAARTDLGAATRTIRKGLEAGEVAYKSMDLSAALKHLRSVREQSERHGLDLLEPELIARIAFLQGLALAEDGRTSQAHVAFKEAIAFDPHQGRIRGYFPAVVEEAMSAALQELRTSHPPELPMESDRLTRLMKQARINQIAIPAILGSGTGRTLRLLVHDRRTKDIVFRASIPLDTPDRDKARIERAISRWRTCAVVETDGETAPRRESQVFADTNFTHGIFLQHPTRQPMQNLGLTIHVGWLALDNLII